MTSNMDVCSLDCLPSPFSMFEFVHVTLVSIGI